MKQCVRRMITALTSIDNVDIATNSSSIKQKKKKKFFVLVRIRENDRCGYC